MKLGVDGVEKPKHNVMIDKRFLTIEANTFIGLKCYIN